MKKRIHRFIILLGVCAVVVAAPSSGQAFETKIAGTHHQKVTKVAARPGVSHRDRIVYVITNTVATGSNIPTVYRVYHNVVTTIGSQNRAVYNDPSISGANDVGEALFRLDPAITLR